jgi:ATP-binding cassette subfamily C (CFTR/MRP) protein 1
MASETQLRNPPWAWTLIPQVVMAYREGLEPALRGISATIKGGEKVGVVGRTGAGKSSMLAVLLRLQELQSGTVCIDGEDIKQMGLATLRSRVGSVPQVSPWPQLLPLKP